MAVAKKVSKKASKKAPKKKAAAASSTAVVPYPSDRRVLSFCKMTDSKYIKPNVTLKMFRAGKQTQFSFNHGNPTAQARRLSIGKFTSRLHFYLQSTGFKAKAGAQGKVEVSLSNKTAANAKLLKAVSENYTNEAS